MFKLSGFFDEVNGSLPIQIEAMKMLNVNHFSPRRINGKNIADYTAKEFSDNILPVLKKEKIQFSSIGSPLGKIPLNDEKKYNEQLLMLKELVIIAKMMNCRYIRVFSFFPSKGDLSTQHDLVVERINGFLKIVENEDITLIHENEKGIYGDVPSRVLALYHSVNHPQFKLCYDASNYLQCGIDAWQAYTETREFTEYYHIKDCFSKIEVPIGTGDGRWHDILLDLKSSGYSGFLTLEPHMMLYALLRRCITVIPFARFSNRGRVYGRIDKSVGVRAMQKVSREQSFTCQYEHLIKILDEIGADYE